MQLEIIVRLYSRTHAGTKLEKILLLYRTVLGYPVVLHYGCVSEQATIKKLVSQLNKSTGEVVKNKPRCLTGNQSAVVEIIVSRPIPLELYKSNRELGRFMLRTGGHTIAAGMVTEIL